MTGEVIAIGENRRTREEVIEAVLRLLVHATDDVGGGSISEVGRIDGGTLPSERSVLNRHAIKRIENEAVRRSYTLLDRALADLRECHPAQYRVLAAIFLNEERSPGDLAELRRRANAGDPAAKRNAVRLAGAIGFLAAELAPYDAHRALWCPPGPSPLAEQRKRERSQKEAYRHYRSRLKKCGDKAQAIREAMQITGYSRAQLYRIIATEEQPAGIKSIS